MTQSISRFRRASLIALLLITGGLLTRLAPSITEAWARNEQALALNHFLSGERTSGKVPTGETAGIGEVRHGGDFSHRDAGFRHLSAGNRDQALEAFSAAGWGAQEFAAMAEHSYDSDPGWAIAWLALATTAAPTNLELLSRLGQRCQFDWSRDDACRQFLTRNGGNHFANPDFAIADLDGWRPIDAPADYSMVSCPDDTETACALIHVMADESIPPAGLGQCFQVKAGTTYLYAAWLKVTTSPEGTWRPLYFQGQIDGEARGNWQENGQGSSDWRYWERTFTAQDFDDGNACFHPIRLRGEGQAWFHGATVTVLAENQ